MHYRRHPNTGGSNPFTGRSLPSNTRSRGGSGSGGDHGNTPSLVGSMTKKAVFIIFTFTIFFYVIFAPDAYDGSSSGISTQHVEQIIKTKEDTSFTNAAAAGAREGGKDAMNNSYVNISSNKPQSEPLKLKLPTELTPDPNDNNNADMMREEGEDNSNDYDGDSSHLRENEEEDEYKDEDEKSKDFNHSTDDENEDEEKQNEREEGLSPAEKVYGAVEDEEAEIESSEQTFKDSETPARGNYSVQEEEVESQYRGSLRGSNTDKNPFGRDHVKAETVGYAKYKEEEEEEEEVVESSGDVDEEDKTIYKKQSLLEIPNSSVIVEVDESTNVEDENTTLNSAKIEKEYDGDDSSEGLSAKEKAAFNAKYGSGTKSMEDELNEQEGAKDMGNSMLNNQPPLEIPNAADTTSKQETLQKKMSSGLTMEEDANKQLKFMADDVDKDEKDESVKDVFKSTEYGDLEKSDELNTKKEFDDNEDYSNTKGKLMSDAIEADEEEDTENYAASDETLKMTEVIPKQKSYDANGDSKEEKLLSSVEEKFKEYLITNSEDEPEKKNLVDDIKGNTTKLDVDEEGGKINESEEADSEAKTEDADAEPVEKSEGGKHTPELTASKKVTDEVRKVEGTKYASHKVERDIDDENASTPGDGSTSEVGENVNSEVIEVENTLSITDATAEKAENTSDVVEKDVVDKGALSSPEEGQESDDLVAEGEKSSDGKTVEKSGQSEHLMYNQTSSNNGVAIGESANAQQQYDKEIDENEVDAGEESQVDDEKSVVDEREEIVKQEKMGAEFGEAVEDNDDESIKYAKVANESNEPDENQENEEAIKLAEDEAETEESLVHEEMKNEIPIQGDLGEAIKESDGLKEEDGGDTTALSSKLDIEVSQIESEEPPSENENDPEGVRKT